MLHNVNVELGVGRRDALWREPQGKPGRSELFSWAGTKAVRRSSKWEPEAASGKDEQQAGPRKLAEGPRPVSCGSRQEAVSTKML